MGRIIDIDTGRMLVASDLQGNWEDYRRVGDRFQQLIAIPVNNQDCKGP